MNQPLVSIVIPTHNRKVMVLRLIKSILASTYKTIEIIVIDDASTDNTLNAIEKTFTRYPMIHMVRNKTNLYTAGSRNIGIHKAKGKYIFFIDDDNVIEKNAIQELVSVFDINERIGELGPVNYSFLDKKKILWVCTKRNMFTTKTYQPRSLKEFSGQKLWNTADVPNAFMVRTKVVKDNNIYFHTKFEIMYEESDFAYRIRNAGFEVKVVRGAKIYHNIENSSRGKKQLDYMYHFMNNSRRPYVFARNRILFHAKYSNKIEVLAIFLIWIWVFTVYYSYKILFYSGIGNFSLMRRVSLVSQYIKGNIDGLYLIMIKKNYN